MGESSDAACPSCKKQGQKYFLEVVEYNYSGCGVDMANCVGCGKGWQISYKVDKIERAKDWDNDEIN